MRMRSAELIASVHRIATGRTITDAEAIEYFHRPSLLREIVEQSACFEDPLRSRQLRDLLDRCQSEPRVQRRCA